MCVRMCSAVCVAPLPDSAILKEEMRWAGLPAPSITYSF